MKTIVTNNPTWFGIDRTIPKSWGADYRVMFHGDVTEETDLSDVYADTDISYSKICQVGRVGNGFTHLLSDLANDKYRCRSVLKTMQSMPFTVCRNNVVEWPRDKDEKLFAKPVGGVSSRNVQIVKHGDKLEDIGEDYIIEKYIDDKYPRISIDGYVMDDVIEVLCVVDSVYDKDEPTKFLHLAGPSEHDSELARQRYKEIVQELREVTKCNNQIIDVEFFVVDDDVIPMEINPRIFGNMVPVYEPLSGYNPWLVMESIKKGERPTKTMEGTYTVVCTYDLMVTQDRSQWLHKTHNDHIFSVITGSYSHTYGVSKASRKDLLIEMDVFRKLLPDMPRVVE